MTEMYPPTRPEPAQPLPGWAGASPDATPTVQFQPYPQQADNARPGPYGYATGYDEPSGYNRATQSQPRDGSPPSGYASRHDQPDWYNNPGQYRPGPGSYGHPQQYPQPPQYGHQVVYQTVMQYRPVVAPRSMGVGYVLWFFLGFFGVHHFYLGRNGQGFAYLLLTLLLGWVGVGLLIVGVALLVDLFLIPTYTRDANYRLTGYRF